MTKREPLGISPGDVTRLRGDREAQLWPATPTPSGGTEKRKEKKEKVLKKI